MGEMKNKNMYLAIGQLSLAISILLNHFIKESAPVSFIIGLLTGLSIVFNLAYVVTVRKEKSNGGSSSSKE
jgi:hypothetical protein